MDFETIVSHWEFAAVKAARAESDFTVAFANALTAAEGKTEKAREAQADLATADARRARDLARIEERAAHWRMQYALATAKQDARAA